jgi:diketogulonate reductase-like aldo/keto reductase
VLGKFFLLSWFQIRLKYMKTVALPDGKRVPVLGQGTWRMGESNSTRAKEVAALRLGIELGMSLIDTAEMYGDGGAEKIVAEAIHGQRQGILWLQKFIRIMRHHRNCQKRASAVSSASASTRLIFTFCIGASERRRSRKLWTHSKSCALPEE